MRNNIVLLFCLLASLAFIFFGVLTQDGSPLLYQGWLFNEYISCNFSELSKTFSLSTTYTSWGGVVLSSIYLKLVGVNHAEQLLQITHLLLFFFAAYLWMKFLVVSSQHQLNWWLMSMVLFWSYGFSKGFYNYLYSVDLLLISLAFIWQIQSQKLYSILGISMLWVLACFFHPMPIVIGLFILPILYIYHQRKFFVKYLFVIPAIVVLALHFTSVTSDTNYIDYSLWSRLGDLLKGFALISYHRQQFLFIVPMMVLIWIATFYILIKSKFFASPFPIILLMLGFIYLIVPQETSGGGLITFRIAWFIYFFIGLYLFVNIEILKQKIKLPLFLKISFLLMFLLLKFYNLPNNSIQISMRNCFSKVEPNAQLIGLYTKLNPLSAKGWLFPVHHYQLQKLYIDFKLNNPQNHFANSDYYPFQYKLKGMVDEHLTKINLDYILKNGCDYLMTDSNIANLNFKLICQANSIDGNHLFMFKRVYAH